MSDIVIQAENLGKKYTIGHQTGRGGQTTFREALLQNIRTLWNRTRDLAQGKPVIAGDTLEEIWALRGVSFEIKRGEAVGIIGRNGAGKSTLLKILSRITEPTTGRVTIKGRVASLLEVGTGFHSELSGRENIFLNGTILGMTRTEIKRKFDEIVAFAEIEKYLDTPVKRYSSGMYVRLAFAVAAHLEPEILVVDEVLAVGDAAFQKKCLGKMNDVASEGKTVLFVSHNMGVIESLCSRGLQLDKGALITQGATKSVISNYLVSHNVNGSKMLDLSGRKSTPDSSREIEFQSVWAERTDGQLANQFEMTQPFVICATYIAHRPIPNALIAVRIETLHGQIIIDSWDSDSLPSEEITPGSYEARIHVDPQDLHPGHYQISLVAAVHMVRWLDRVDGALRFEITAMSSTKVWRAERNAILARILTWERTRRDNSEERPLSHL